MTRECFKCTHITSQEFVEKRGRLCALFLAEHSTISPSVFHSQSWLAFFEQSEWSSFPSRTTMNDTIFPTMVKELKERNKKVCISIVLLKFTLCSYGLGFDC